VFWNRTKHLFERKHDFYAEVRAEMGDPPLTAAASGTKLDMYRRREVIGDPVAVLGEFDKLRTRLPISDIVITGHPAGLDPRGEVHDALELFASEVLPTIHRW
jgi:hypothetical protein